MHSSTERHARAFFIAGEKIIHIANPAGAGLAHQAVPTRVAPGAQSKARMHEGAETVIVVERGTIDLMVNGAVFALCAGQFARVAPGQCFAWRNTGREAAELLVKTVPPTCHKRACKVMLSIAAA